MKYREIIELKKRMDFNLTYHETLVKLVKEAQKKGKKAQREMNRLRKLSSKVLRVFNRKKLLYTESSLQNVNLEYKVTVGIDGSRQLVGGVGGRWYAPISVARVIFPKGIQSTPKVDIFWAGIEEIQEQKDHRPEITAEIMMLMGETRAILNWGRSARSGLVFIDGPIVDPPFYSDRKYIKDRCKAITTCLDNSLLIGCVKRSRDRFYIDYLVSSVKVEDKILKNFPSDQHLMAYIFTSVRHKGYQGSLFTKWIDISEVNSVYKKYKKNGVNIVCFFFQKSLVSQVLRVDVPFSFSLKDNESEIDDVVIKVAKAVNDWTYPGQDYPIPIILAHDKCNIREGCAEVLYDEIITRSRSVDPLNQTISTQLR